MPAIENLGRVTAGFNSVHRDETFNGVNKTLKGMADGDHSRLRASGRRFRIAVRSIFASLSAKNSSAAARSNPDSGIAPPQAFAGCALGL